MSTTVETEPLVIEVCERLMDYCMVPLVNPMKGTYQMVREPKYHAKVKGGPGPWGAGRNRDEAIGSLVRSHPELFGATVDYLGKLPR